MGVFEFPLFEDGTKQTLLVSARAAPRRAQHSIAPRISTEHERTRCAQACAEATRRGAVVIIGGGDTASAAKKFKVADKVSRCARARRWLACGACLLCVRAVCASACCVPSA